jgi:multidrug efflux pump subunit AcrB
VTGLSLRNPIAVLMLCIGLVVFSVVVTPRMPVDTFPELTPPVLIIGTLAPGLGAKDVEKTLSWRLEKYVSATPGVDHVESLSRNNFSVIYVWLKWGTDLSAAQTLVQSQAGFAMAAVPKSLGVLPPFVLQYDPSNAPVCEVVVSGAGYASAQLYDYAFNYIEPLLEGISGVASAAPYGGQMRQINVVVDPTKAQARRVTANDVAAAVSRSNALLPSGELLAKRFDANVYTNAIPKEVATIGDATVKVVDGKPVLIRDVSRVVDGGTPETESVAVNGKDAVYLAVLRIPGGNTIEIVDAVKKVVEGLNTLPPGMQAKVYFDQSTFVRGAYHGLKKEIVQALVLIALVILLFLQSVRGTLIVSVAIPLSFAITLIVLYATGQTLNAFTLGGLTLAMGRLVDDAVVVLEAIHRHQRMGMSTAEAALKGTNSVALPVLASTLTTMAVLLPVVLLAGLARKLFAPLAITVAVAMIASYFVSMAVTPVACRYFLGHAEHGRFGKAVEGFIDRIADGYARALRKVLPFRALIIGASVVLVAAAAWTAARLPSTFFPEIDESMDTLYVRVAAGASIADASKTFADIGKTITRELGEGVVEMSIANIGMPQNARALLTNTNVAPNTGTLQLAFADAEHRTMSQGEIATKIRAIVTREFPGVEVLQYPGGLVASVFANGYTAPFVMEVANDNLAELNEEAHAVAEVARTVPGIRDVKVSIQLDYPEIHVDTDREMAGLVGTSERDAAETTLEGTLGNINTPGVWIDENNGQSYYVVTSYDGDQVSDTQALGALPVRMSPNGNPVLLRAYGNVRRALGAVSVERNHLQRVAHVLMQTEDRDLGSAAADLERALHADPRTEHIAARFVGQVDLMRTTFGGLGLALGLAVMVVFMIMASQFKSVRLPFIMLFTIPVSLVGIVLALMAAGQGFSITALMGILMVIGIAVSNGILLVDDANRRYVEEGADKVEAIVAAARSRFVPIAMTSLATVIGLIPTAMGLERGSEANQPLALAVVGGLTSSTILSLFLVPVMFLFFARRGAPEEGHTSDGVPLGAHA